MRYAQIVPFEVCNGKYAGVSVFVQGCSFHCPGCFNPGAWAFNGGKEFTAEVKDKLLTLVSKPYIKRVSILGGEPLVYENLQGVLKLVRELKGEFPEKTIWIYTGYTMEEILNPDPSLSICNRKANESLLLKRDVLRDCDVVVDGRFEIDKRDVTLRFRGSSNQIVWKKQDGIWVKWITD